MTITPYQNLVEIDDQIAVCEYRVCFANAESLLTTTLDQNKDILLWGLDTKTVVGVMQSRNGTNTIYINKHCSDRLLLENKENLALTLKPPSGPIVHAFLTLHGTKNLLTYPG